MSDLFFFGRPQIEMVAAFIASEGENRDSVVSSENELLVYPCVVCIRIALPSSLIEPSAV